MNVGRRRLGVQDALWLEMDRPNNLMVVDSVIWTAEPLDRDRARAVMTERLWDRYPVFRSRPVRDADGSWWWEEVAGASFEDLVTDVELDDPDDPRSLQELVAAHRTEPLARDRPLWRVLWVDRYLAGSAVIMRSHHAIADGMRMVQLAMSLFDAAPSGGPILAPAVRQHGARPAAPGQPLGDRLRAGAGHLGRQAAGVAQLAADAAGEAAALAGRTPATLLGLGTVARGAATNPLGTVHGLITGAWALLGDTGSTLRSSARAALPGGGPLVDLFSAAPGDVDVARKLLVGTRNDATIWTGTAGTDKAVAWSEPLPLAEVKAVARAHGATVNDVLVACVAGTLRRYLDHQGAHCSSVTFMVPVNLTPIDLTLPEELGNSFALVQLELPTDETDPVALLRVAHHRMDRIKHGHEAAVAFRIQEAIAGFNRSIYEASVDLLANRTVGTLTNVPGPPMPVYLAGTRVEGMTGWAPLSGDQPMSFTIYSYDGRVTVGIACDRGLVPDHHLIVDGFAPAFGELRDRTPGLATGPTIGSR
jgi:diacylglycerol O-acyltransferase